MFADTPPPTPQVTVEQAAYLRCLGIGLFAGEQLGGAGQDMMRVYLSRLEQSDPSRDWKAIAPKYSEEMSYAEFMGLMNGCALPPKPDEPATPRR